MKLKLLVALSALAFAAPSHALVGLAVSAGLNSTTISGADQTMVGATLPKAFSNDTGASLVVHRTKLSGMTQFGVKAWLELPVIPVEFEVASNIAWGYYQSSLILNSAALTHPDTIKVDVPAPIPGESKKSGETPYFSWLTDLTFRYPILQLPPLSPIQPLKLWVGAGPTYVVASRVVDQSDLESIYGTAGSYTVSATGDAAAEAAARKTFINNLTTNTWGAHLAVGAQLKIPVVPIALFIDGKWYLHVATSSAASKYPFVVNIGAGLSI
jgi:hypothetical protein